MTIGVISDTHNFLDPRIPGLFQGAGVEHILHAGDIGQPSLLAQLRQVAPVTCVAGNTDDPALGFKLFETAELDGRRFLLHHIVNPRSPSDSVRAAILRERAAAVVFGHSHKPYCGTSSGVLFFNPGYAGKPRFALPRSIAVIRSDAEGLHPELITLDGR